MSMDEGLPIAYVVLERNVPVYASGGELVGTVDHVVAAREQEMCIRDSCCTSRSI